jgi:hypothetical protein
VQKIGESGCRTMHACLVGAQSNPLFRASNPPGMHFYADCADLPYMLRAYYAWKNGLPFSYSTAVTPLGFSKDIRYTARGNAIAGRRDLVDAAIDARRPSRTSSRPSPRRTTATRPMPRASTCPTTIPSGSHATPSSPAPSSTIPTATSPWSTR